MTEIVEASEDLTLHERVNRGRKFERFLSAEETVSCFDIQRRTLIIGLETATTEADAMKYWSRLRALNDVKLDLQAVIDDGKLAQSEIGRQERVKDQGPPSKPRTKRASQRERAHDG